MSRSTKPAKPYIVVFCEGESEQAYTDFLRKEFKDVADRLGCHFIDAGSISGIEMYPYDWMHLSLDSHRIFAEYLAEYLPKIV